MITREAIKDIIKAGTMAPSGDNSQPWRFEVEGDKVVIILVDKDIALINYRLRGTLMAHGAALENMRLAAAAKGLDSQISVLMDKEKIASIRFFDGRVAEDDKELAKYIPSRVTNHKPFKKVPLPVDFVEFLEKETGTVGGGVVSLTQDQRTVRDIGKLSGVFERVVLEFPPLHRVFFDHVVWSEEEELQKHTGLYVKTLELSPPEEFGFGLYRSSKTARVLNALGFSRLIAAQNGRLYGESGSIIGLSAASDNDAEYITLGRLLERIWLRCHQFGLSAQPLTGVQFLNQTLRGEGPGGFMPGHVAMVEKAYDKIASLLQVQKGETLAFMLRVGYSDPPSARSTRLPPQIMFK